MTAKVCGVCHAGFRGSYTIHQGTKKHRRLAGPRFVRTIGHKRATRRSQAHKAFIRDEGADHVKVRHHHRSPPNDGRRRVVKVRTYWRWDARKFSAR